MIIWLLTVTAAPVPPPGLRWLGALRLLLLPAPPSLPRHAPRPALLVGVGQTGVVGKGLASGDLAVLCKQEQSNMNIDWELFTFVRRSLEMCAG